MLIIIPLQKKKKKKKGATRFGNMNYDLRNRATRNLKMDREQMKFQSVLLVGPELLFGLLNSLLFIFRWTVQSAPNFLLWNAHIFLFDNPTRHSKFHNTSNHPPPVYDSGRTARTPLCIRSPPPPPLVPTPPFFPVLDTGTGKGRYLCPWQACATTACSECAR